MVRSRIHLFFLMGIASLVSCSKREEERQSYLERRVNLNLESLRMAVSMSDGGIPVESFRFQTSDSTTTLFFPGRPGIVFRDIPGGKQVPDISIASSGGDFVWTVNGTPLAGRVPVSEMESAPQVKFSDGMWFVRIPGISDWTRTEGTETRIVPTVYPEGDRMVTMEMPTGVRICFPMVSVIETLKPNLPEKTYFKDVFLDAGIGLTTCTTLPAFSYLGLTHEYISFEEMVDSQKEINILAGDETDLNGRLLYPDGQPRFKVVFVVGGNSRTHGKALSSAALENMRTFYERGGSYVGVCAGAFFASNGYDGHKDYRNYLKLWPTMMNHTGLTASETGMFLEPGNPLSRYYGLGETDYIDKIRHNKGGYPVSVPSGAEVIARFDYPEIPAMHRQPSVWAYKESEETGRLVLTGSHPESVTKGDQRDLTAAMILYAMDGLEKTSLKAFLQYGDTYTATIGDGQTHNYLVCLSPSDKSIRVVLDAPGNGTVSRTDRVVDGCWCVSVRCDIGITVSDRKTMQTYSGRTDVLNGLPYTLKVESTRE